MGESARKPGAPTLPLTPQDLLTARPGEGFTLFEKYLTPVALCGAMAFSPCVNNWRLNRPFFAGIQVHIILGAIGYFIGDRIAAFRREQRAEKDAILLHYISLHPEDFPPIERQRYKDLFLPWTPRR